jgi:hypothetical protein
MATFAAGEGEAPHTSLFSVLRLAAPHRNPLPAKSGARAERVIKRPVSSRTDTSELIVLGKMI